MPKGLPVSLEVLNLSGAPYLLDAHKFTGGIPSEWGALTNLRTLEMANCSLDGKGSAPGLSASYFELMYSLFAGELPKELGKLVNLKVFNARYNGLRGGLSTRSELC